eukprot:TRINITY_DN9014_c0_g1_i5.p1 TRINITY_DN9014_c0_g1~~TRINITY_DN9014_c0_g1_i5.p1  ORF type:complete len:292 (-),score=42.80 TRINITY_DN9014_c0_g1_i5:51-926(-)
MTLPHSLPPTFIGSAVRYAYFISMSASQEALGPSFVARFPFRVISPSAGFEVVKNCLLTDGFNIDCTTQPRGVEVESLLNSCRKSEYRFWSKKVNHVVPSLCGDLTGGEVEQVLDMVNAKRKIQTLFDKYNQPTLVNIMKHGEHVVQFSTPSSVFRLGDSLRGSFNFSNGLLPCHQVVVVLQYTEKVNPSLVHHLRRNVNPLKHQVDLFSETTVNVIHTSFVFEIPFHLCPQFSTPLVEIKWSLDISFVIAKKGSKEMETLLWNFPLHVLVPEYPEEIGPVDVGISCQFST